jgi:glutamyl-tRNA synthetase
VIRVRFAPSPTGYLHIGSARTALFNWLLARRYGGVFVLRIEDTDTERSSDDMVEGILDGMRWLGLDWTEGPLVGGPYAPYSQSERVDRHRAMAARLVTSGHAYYCYCSPEELKAKRESVKSQRGADPGGDARAASDAGWKYDRTCRKLTPAQIAANEAAHRPRAVRFLVPEGVTRFNDLVRGPIEFDNANIEDFVILRSDDHPIYHLSVVSDDIDMKITHVLRGDDHISNTPKHVLLFEALGAPLPEFAHVPLILGADKKRLSKRHGATSVMEYAGQGYLPEAMVNFLTLLGWSPGSGDRELFSATELGEVFDVRGISGGNAVFNQEKLDWFNQQYILRLTHEELAKRLKPFFEAADLWDAAFLTSRHAWFFAILELLKPRAKRLDEFVELGRFFFSDDLVYDAAAVAKHLKVDGLRLHLQAVLDVFSGLETFDPVSLEAALRAVAEQRGVKAGMLIHALRVAVTGRAVSPGLFEVLSLLGRDKTIRRLESAMSVSAGPSS